MSEYVATINEQSVIDPSALSIETEYLLNSVFSLGGRLQNTYNFTIIDGGNGKYKEIAIAVNYNFNEYSRLSFEYIQGREGTNRPSSLLITQLISQLCIIF